SGKPVARGAADGVLAAEGTPMPPAFGPGSAGSLQKRGLLGAIDLARRTYPDKRITLWFEDEARIGQKGRVCHRWWTRGQRPPGLCDPRYTGGHLFAAAPPAAGDRFALVMPVVSSEAMSIFGAGPLAPDIPRALV